MVGMHEHEGAGEHRGQQSTKDRQPSRPPKYSPLVVIVPAPRHGTSEVGGQQARELVRGLRAHGRRATRTSSKHANAHRQSPLLSCPGELPGKQECNAMLPGGTWRGARRAQGLVLG